MLTTTHLLIGAAALARPGQRWRNAGALAGGLAPDLPIYALWMWSKVAGIPEAAVWRDYFFRPEWQRAADIGHSLPLHAAVLALGLSLARGRPGALASFLAAFAAAALLHVAADFPVHVDDAHAHFWPLSEWRFRAPISYWDPRHHGDVFRWAEIALGIALAALLWRRFRAPIVRTLLALAVLLYAGVPLYFALAMRVAAP
jgi:hypothetical protein